MTYDEYRRMRGIAGTEVPSETPCGEDEGNGTADAGSVSEPLPSPCGEDDGNGMGNDASAAEAPPSPCVEDEGSGPEPSAPSQPERKAKGKKKKEGDG